MGTKINIHALIIYLIGLLPITTLFVMQDISNKILFLGFIVCFLYTIIREYKIEKRDFILLIVLLLEFFMSYFITAQMPYFLNDMFYLPLWILLLLYFTNEYETFYQMCKKKIIYLERVVKVWALVFLVLRAVIPTANEEFAHRTASSAFLIIVIVWFIVKETGNKWFILWMIPPMICVFFMNARTYLIVAMIVACMSYYGIFEKKRYFFLTIIPVLFITILMILQTEIGQRFLNFEESYYGGVLGTITSSRSVFWMADLQDFLNTTTLKQIFGSGYNRVYDVNAATINARIWGHNDIIHILVTNGVLGIILYLYPLVHFLKQYKRNVNIDKWLLGFVICIIAFCALLDGLYHYICALFTLPILLSGLRQDA